MNSIQTETFQWPASPLPCRRSDLVVSALGESGTYVAKEPGSGAYYQLGEEEHFLLNQLDGTRSAENIGMAFEERFGQMLPPEELDEFVAMAQSRGLVEEPSASEPAQEANGDAVPRPRTAPPSTPRQSVFHWRKSVCDPDRFFTWLAPKIHFFWTRGFLALSGGCILVAGLVFWTNHVELANRLAHALSWETAGWTILTMAIVVALHESAHGLTCKHYGGEVHEMGFLFVQLQPAFFCNVSDAWLFSEKPKRLWVTFAGAWFELFVWALATLVWRLTEADAWPNQLALVVMTASGLATLFNFNPLIKLDGYYLLSDYLEIPNLRQRAFSYLGDCTRRLLGSSTPCLPQVTLREKCICLTYGLIACVFSAALLAVTLAFLWTVLTSRFQVWGIALFATFLGLTFGTPLARAFRGAAPACGLNQPVTCWARRLAWLGLCGGLLAANYYLKLELRVPGPFTVLPLQHAELRPEVEGIIEEIFVDEGARISAGEPIARLSDPDGQTELQKTRAEIAEQEARVRLLKAGSRPEEIEMARSLVSQADERLKFARSRLETDTKLYDSQLLALIQLKESEEMVAVCTAERNGALGKLNLLLAGNRPEEIEAVEAQLGRLKAQEQHLQDRLRRLTVVSPIAGVLTTHRLREKIGQNVRKGEPIAVVQELGTVVAEMAIPEKEIADVRLGQQVALKARAFPEKTFPGTVTAITPVATPETDPQRPKVFVVTTQIPNASHLLASEMTGHAKIYCGKRRVMDLVTRRLVRYLRVEVWSWF